LFGDIRDASLLEKIKLKYSHIGRVNDQKTLRHLYAMASVVLSTSHYETLGATLIEGQAAGCVPVAFAHDGRKDIIDHKINGYIASYKSPQSIADGIAWAIETSPDREMLHRSVHDRFASQVIAQKYIKLFQSLIS
jgi:glycosyltransferase involved in cell wall biosynthesis